MLTVLQKRAQLLIFAGIPCSFHRRRSQTNLRRSHGASVDGARPAASGESLRRCSSCCGLPAGAGGGFKEERCTRGSPGRGEAKATTAVGVDNNHASIGNCGGAWFPLRKAWGGRGAKICRVSGAPSSSGSKRAFAKRAEKNVQFSPAATPE